MTRHRNTTEAANTTTPAVSVLVPAFNPGRYLHDALASVLGQTLGDWEAIVIDDGSTEDLSWVDGLDARISRIRQPNAGLSAARNTGVAASRAGIVALLDADDLWLPDKLADQVAAFEDPDLALVSTAFTIVDGDGATISAGYEGYADSYELLLQGNGIGASTVALRRDVVVEVGGFDTSLDACEDWDLWLRIAADHKLRKLPNVLARYRLHDGNASKDYRAVRRNGRIVLGRQIAIARRAGHHEHERLGRLGLRRLDALLAAQAFDAARRSGPRRPLETARHLAHAIRMGPRFTIGQLRQHVRMG